MDKKQIFMSLLVDYVNIASEFIYDTFGAARKLTLKEAKNIHKIMAFLQENYDGEDTLVETKLDYLAKKGKEILDANELSQFTGDFYHHLLFLQRYLAENK